jgi:hypothetical protein
MKQTLGLLISSAALTFQVTVLYPWHNEISKQIKELTDKNNNVDT